MSVFLGAPANKWTDLLPAPLNSDPEVVVILAPKGASAEIRETLDGKLGFGLMIANGKTRGLQVIYPEISNWDDNRKVFKQRKITPATVRYRGPLSEIPNKALMGDTVPLVFLAHAAFKPYVSIKSVVNNLEKVGNIS